MGLSEIFIRMAYIRGSLINVDLDGDGVYDGFSFRLRNPPVPMAGKVIRMEIFVDGEPIDNSKVYINIERKLIRVSDISPENPLTFTPGTRSIFMVLLGRGLEEGVHRIQIRSWLEGFEQVWIPFEFEDEVESEEVKLELRREEKVDFSYPIILSSERGYAVLSRSGDLSANWNWMGVTYNIGGFYIPPAKVLGPIEVGVKLDGEIFMLGNHVERMIHGPGYIVTEHNISGLKVTRKTYVSTSNPSLIQDIEFDGEAEFMIRGIGGLVPYGLLGLTPQSVKAFYDKSINGVALWSRDLGYYGIIGSSGRLVSYELDGHEGVSELTLPLPTFKLSYKADGSLRIVVSGSTRKLEDALKFTAESLRHYDMSRTILHYITYINKTTSFETDDPEINTAFKMGKLALFYMMMRHPELGVGVMAGLPRFPTFWGRDTGWVLQAFINVCEWDFVRDALENMLSRAKDGEIPMIIGGRGFLHVTSYGSTDATLYYPWLIREYVMGHGDIEFLQKWYPTIVKMIEWGYGRDLDGDGFLDHGESVTGLLPVPDTTWMDHIDRRKSAIEVQALWVKALESGSELAEAVGDSKNACKWKATADEIKKLMVKKYWNEVEGYFYDTIRPNGEFDSKIRPNAMVPVMMGYVEPEKALRALKRIERTDMMTPWGVRTLSSRDPRYNPKAYHDGCVWPLVTGWTAQAELEYGRVEEGFNLVKVMAGQILREAGMYAELYRGDREEPFNACILQAWSIASYINSLFRIVGLRKNALKMTLDLNPQTPEELTHIILKRVRVGDANLTIALNQMVGEAVVHHIKGSNPITIRFRGEERSIKPGEKVVTPL